MSLFSFLVLRDLKKKSYNFQINSKVILTGPKERREYIFWALKNENQ